MPFHGSSLNLIHNLQPNQFWKISEAIKSRLNLTATINLFFLETGVIKTNTVVNATGVWGKDLLKPHGIHLPLVPMKHAYVISETIKEVQGMPNVRDHDYSTYFRIQGRCATAELEKSHD